MKTYYVNVFDSTRGSVIHDSLVEAAVCAGEGRTAVIKLQEVGRIQLKKAVTPRAVPNQTNTIGPSEPRPT